MTPRRRHTTGVLIGRATEAVATIRSGTFVSWPVGEGREAHGLVIDIHDSGLVPGIAHTFEATSTAPAARVQLFAETARGWESTTAYLGFAVSALKATADLKLAPAREATVVGSFDAIRTLVRNAITERIKTLSGVSYPDTWVYDLGSTWAVYCVGYNSNDMWLVDYTLAADELSVELGVAIAVRPVMLYQPVAGTSADVVTEAVHDGNGARVLESKGATADGGHIYRVLIIAYGDSLNNRRYNEAVMRPAAPLYEGSKAYDHHRTDAEIASSTIEGLIGTYRNVSATPVGIEGDLCLLPSATHAKEALDMALANEALGHSTFIGISQDVNARWKPISVAGRPMMEAVEILSVNSNDLVAHPAAGGKATRMVASSDPNVNPQPPRTENTVDLKQLIAALRAAESAKRPALLTEHASVLEANGLTEADALRLCEAAPPVAPAPVVPAPVDPSLHAKSGMVGQMIIRGAVEAAQLGAHMVEAITAELPEQFTESEVTARVASAQKLLAGFERSRLEPTVPAPNVKVTESLEKKVAALDAYFAGDTSKGFRSFKEAFISIAGELGPQVKLDPFSADFNRRVMRESAQMLVGGGRENYDSMRATESMTTTSWGEILGDSITRRMIAEYGLPSLQTWRDIVSSIYTVNDFRTQRIDRLGGYGVLPTVLEGAPYQGLTSPTDEEVTYAIAKKGGTDDLTIEMVTNDDMRSITRIPTKLGRAAAQTLYRFVWDLLEATTAIYDGIALFHASHGNTATNALSGANLSTARRNMRKQTAYGDASELLGMAPAFLVVVSELEELAWELSTSQYAMPSGAPVGAATALPNIHQGIKPIVVDYWSSTTKWVAIADPKMCPTIEVGFLNGQQEPSLFVQNDPNNGSAFSADKITYKVRHIYGGAVVDYRGFQRGNV